MSSFAIVIPTWNAGEAWRECLQSIRHQSLAPSNIFIIDSSSTDSTREIAKEFGCVVEKIPQVEFSHGKTRQYSLSLIKQVDYVVFLTQDAILANISSVEILLESFEDNEVAAAFGRQLPRCDSTTIEAFERNYNYAAVSSCKILDDAKKLGIKTPFISNSFSAYRVKALNNVGGFPNHTILAEDMYVGARMLLAGWKIFYNAEATVFHSHNYSMFQTFQRYFDTGVFHAREPWIRNKFGGSESEGFNYLCAEFDYLLKHRFSQIPRALSNNAVKLIGYKIGFLEKYLPIAVKRKISMCQSFWV